MQIKEMFAKKIDREIQGVIIVGQGEIPMSRRNLKNMLSPASCKSILPISTLLIRRALWGLPQKWAFGFPVSLEAVNLTF